MNRTFRSLGFQVLSFLRPSIVNILSRWPTSLETTINAQDPLKLAGEGTSVYLSSSPPQFCPHGREVDIDAIRQGSISNRSRNLIIL